MDSLMALLDLAAGAGLRISIDGDKIEIRGPKAAEPLVRKIIGRKDEIMRWWFDRPSGEPSESHAGWKPRELPWRRELEAWTDGWRERWGRLAGDYEDAIGDWFEAERAAFEDMKARKIKSESLSAPSWRNAS
ncbi:hypothetical protein [Singulisphaera sp. PoT]|uniref:hypothetical protein n=1 Tax=Singulisphaera sp. PoT TaxID=3411797 RepID=UPI003BF56BA8